MSKGILLKQVALVKAMLKKKCMPLNAQVRNEECFQFNNLFLQKGNELKRPKSTENNQLESMGLRQKSCKYK